MYKPKKKIPDHDKTVFIAIVGIIILALALIIIGTPNKAKGQLASFTIDAITNIDSTMILDDGVGHEDIQPDAIGTSEIGDDEILESDLDCTDEASDNQVLTYDQASGGFSWEDDQTGGTTTYDNIGDPTAAGSITFESGETGTYTSAASAWGGLLITNTVADMAANGMLLTLTYDDDADANARYLLALNDADGDDDTVFIIAHNGAYYGLSSEPDSALVTKGYGDANWSGGGSIKWIDSAQVYNQGAIGVTVDSFYVLVGHGMGVCTDSIYLDATLIDISDGTIAENLVNTDNPWAANEIDVTDNFAWTGTHTFTNNTAPLIKNETNGASVEILQLEGDQGGTPADSDEVYISATLSDDAPSQQEFARITAKVQDVSTADPDGILRFSVMDAGALTQKAQVEPTGLNAVKLSTGNGFYELQDADDDGLTKGLASFDNTDFDATSGNVTIVDDGHSHTTTSLTEFGTMTATSGRILVADGGDFESCAMSGDATIASGGAMTIENDAVEEAMLNVASAPNDNELLTYNDGGTNFDWHTQDELNLMRNNGDTVSGTHVFANAFRGNSAVAESTYVTLESIEDSLKLVGRVAGQTWTGAHDFGGATSVEITNNDNPTTDAPGEITIDNNDNAFEIYISAESESALKSFYDDKEFFAFAPDQINDEVKFYHFNSLLYPHGVEIDSVSILLPGDAAYSMVFEEWAGDPPTAQNDVSTVTTGSSDSYASEAPDTDADLDAGDYLFLHIPATDVDWISCKVIFHVKEGN